MNTMDHEQTPSQPLDTDQPPALPGTPAEVTPTAVTLNEATPCGGAPALNLHHAGSMLASSPELGQLRLKLGTLPPSLARIERDTNKFRRLLEDAVELAHGRVDLTAACSISTACRWERHAGLALRWLRDNSEKMDDSTRLAYSREIARASSERDKAIAALRLGAAKQTIAATLYPALNHDH